MPMNRELDGNRQNDGEARRRMVREPRRASLGWGRRSFATAALSALLLVTSAHAGSEGGLIQSGWYVYPDGTLFFHLNGTHVNSPCPDTERWGIDTTTPVGKAQYASFLLAYSLGLNVSIYGYTPGCIHGNTEVASQINVN